MTEQQEYTDRLETLQELMEAEEWDKVIFDCQSLLQLLKHNDDENESESDAVLIALLLEIQAKSFLQQDEWQQVIDLAAKNKTASILQSLAAYAQYRLGNYVEAKQMAAILDNDDLSRHVLAQSMYRLGQAKEGAKVYTDLLSSASNDEEEGRMQMLTNALAVRNSNAHPIPSSSTADDATTSLLKEAEDFLQSAGSQDDLILYDYYDLAYNLGTLQILMGQAADGRATLQAAERAVQDEWAGEDADACEKDLASIQTNLQWSLLLQGETSAVGTKRNDFISKLNSGNKTIPMKDMPVTMTPLQRRVYHYNQAILALKMKSQAQLVKLHCMSLLQSFNTKKKNGVACSEETWWKSRVAVLEAQVLEQQQKPQDAKKHLQLQLNASSGDDAATAWLQLHIARLEGKLDSTSKDRLTVLESLPPSIVQSRAVVATRAALYQAAGENVPADLFSNDEQDAADFMLSQGNYEMAAAYFSSQTDSVSRAKYALCLSYSNPQEALKVWKALNIDEDDIVAGAAGGNAKELTGEELEQLPLPRVKAAAARAVTSLSNANPKRRSHDAVLARRAKQREAYLANQKVRGLDTTRAPNPERWIPKYERSKNRKRGQHKGAQGGFTEKDAAKYDVAARQANGGVVSGGGPSTAHIKVVSDGGTGGRRGGRRR